jgi:D-alanyl-D-alanine carboxypeptidase
MRICHRVLWFFAFWLTALPAQDLDSRLSGQIVAALRKSGAPSVSVAVVRDGKIAYAKAFGTADVAAGRAADAGTRYAIGSVSKQFTAAALLLLQEEGRLSLDDPVAKYFPNLTRAADITIRQLLSHTSGYEDYAPQDYLIPDWTRSITPQALLERWAAKPLNFEPGTRWQYSNTNFVLAAQIFEKASGRRLVDFLRERIFEPLEMRTAADWAGLPSGPSDAMAYTRFALGPPRPVGREAAGWYSGAAELAMTASDLARWDIAFLERKILAPRSYEEFTREVTLQNGDRTHYALGLSLGERSGAPAVSHTGEVSGFLASNVVFPTRRTAVVVLSNQDGVNLIGPLSGQIAATLFAADRPAASGSPDAAPVRAILEGLRAGRIDRALFTAHANSYFTETALRDCRQSLGRLGKLKSVTSAAEQLRGGMTHRTYRAEFARKTLTLNIYVTAEGKYEQFMVEDPVE